MRRIAAALSICLLTSACFGQHAASTPANTKAVLVTGASTGIGRKIAERLAADGYFVYAGARKESDLKALGAIKNVQAIQLDVTKTTAIANAMELIAKGGRGLYGLVNNAGVATAGTLAETSAEEFDLVMTVNVYGPYRMTKAALPLLLASKGRITTIGSISGVLASQNLFAYSMSKHAVEAFTDSLAQQLESSGIIVNIVEPGDYNSAIGKSAAERMGPRSSSVDATQYRLLADRSQFKEPDEVAEAVEHALFDPTPKRRYMVTPNLAEAELTIRKQIRQLAQLNEGQPYTYDRDSLVKMLDEALVGSRARLK